MLVQRRGGTVSLKAVTDAISKVQTGTDKTAAELALTRLDLERTRLNEDIKALKSEIDSAKAGTSTDLGCALILAGTVGVLGIGFLYVALSEGGAFQ